MQRIRRLPILRCQNESCTQTQDSVVRETRLRIVLIDSQGDENFAFIHTLPGESEALILGLLFTSRIISRPSDILRLSVRNHLAKVHLSDACEMRKKLEALQPTARIVAGVCGPEESSIGVWQACDLPPIETSYSVKPSIIRKAVQQLNARLSVYRKTGGTHGAGLADPTGELVFLAEDIGRHSAVDRVIGKGLNGNLNLTSTILVSTGRLTSDLVLKVAVAQIPVLASIGAAVDSGIELADAAGITLIGFVRGTRMNVYTHPNRLKIPKG